MVSPIAPGRQFGRVVRMTITPAVGAPIVINPLIPVPGVTGPELHVSFAVAKSLTPEPQRATVQIVNLSKTTRDLISTYARRPTNTSTTGGSIDSRVFASTRCVLEAGYAGASPGAVFTGDLASAVSRHEGTEWITTLQLGDSEVALAQAECDRSFTPGSTAIEVVTYALGVLGLGLAPNPVPAALSSYVLSRGWVAVGRARETIDAILAGVAPSMAGLNSLARGVLIIGGLFDAFTGVAPLTQPLTWWAEDGLAYFLERGGSLPGEPLVVTADATPGTVRLLDRPERLDDGAIAVRMLLHPGVRIGRPLTVASRELAGAYRVEALQHAGDNRTGGFDTKAVLRVLS